MLHDILGSSNISSPFFDKHRSLSQLMRISNFPIRLFVKKIVFLGVVPGIIPYWGLLSTVLGNVKATLMDKIHIYNF